MSYFETLTSYEQKNKRKIILNISLGNGSSLWRKWDNEFVVIFLNPLVISMMHGE